MILLMNLKQKYLVKKSGISKTLINLYQILKNGIKI